VIHNAGVGYREPRVETDDGLEHVFAVNVLALVAEATGSSLAPYGTLALAVFHGREAQAAHLIQIATDDVGRRGEGGG
jgi:hypothetical protein